MSGINTLLGNTSSPYFWAAWSIALVWQNYAFTRVSRARNSGSLKAHALAALQSNGVWFLQSLFVYSAFMNILTGKAGAVKAIGAALYYTAFTMAGSIYAHYISLKKEKGKTAVGANSKYAQIPVEDWQQFQQHVIDVTKVAAATLKAVNELPTKEEHAQLAEKVAAIPSTEEFTRIRGLAENAYDCVLGFIPDSGASAKKIGGITVATGVPEGTV